MKIEELKSKIPEVRAAARIIVQEYGHTKKFAKHIVALVVKQIKHLTDIELVEFVGTDKIGNMLVSGVWAFKKSSPFMATG